VTQELTPGKETDTGTGAIATSLFPAKPADGQSFIDRTEEHKRLTADISAARSAWFDCPPRYGVNSLIEQVRGGMRYWRKPRITSTNYRLHTIHDTQSFCAAMLEGVGQLASQTIRRPNVEAEIIDKLFVGVDMQIYLDEKHLQTIGFLAGRDPLKTLIQVTRDLDTIAGEHDCRSVYIVHDLQQILALRESSRLLDTLHNIIDASKNATWLMQGNNRNAMHRLFLDEDARLHGCCARFTLRPIKSSVYSQYLADAAQSQWNCFIGRKATAMILALTERHPYWFNLLCRRLWSSDLPPVIQDVVNEWLDLVRQQHHISSRQMEHLSPNQRAVLRCLAETPTDQPRAKAFVARTRVSSASVGQAIKILAEQDLVKLNPDGVWSVADPVMQWSLYPRTDIVDQIYEKLPDLYL